MVDLLGSRTLSLRWKSALGIALCSLALGLAGCSQPEEVVIYEIPTTPPAKLLPEKRRTLAAMVPQGKDVWFFKVSGPTSAVERIASTFRGFVADISIEAGEPVLESLPDGWRRGGNKPMRFASIDVNTEDHQLDLSVSTLGRQDDWDQFVSMNVNRWRNQLGLAPSEQKWAGGEPIDVAAADGASVWVDILGEASDPSSMMPSSMMPGSMMPGRMMPPPRSPPPPADRTANAQPQEEDSRLKFETPDGWRLGRRTQMRIAAFEVGPEESKAELTVIQAGGELRANIQVWLGQVRSEQVAEHVDQALASGTEVEVDGRSAQRFFLTGDDANKGDAIDVTVVPIESGSSLFVKMKGPVATVTDQADEIAAFLKSLKLQI